MNYPLAQNHGGAMGNGVSADLAFLESGSVQGPRRRIEAHRFECDHSSVGKRSEVGERRLSFFQHGGDFVFEFALSFRMRGEQVPAPCERSRSSFVSRNEKRHDVVSKLALAAACIAGLGRIEQKRQKIVAAIMRMVTYYSVSYLVKFTESVLKTQIRPRRNGHRRRRRQPRTPSPSRH